MRSNERPSSSPYRSQGGGEGQFNFDLEEAARSAKTTVDALILQQRLVAGGLLIFEEYLSGFRFTLFELREGEIPMPTSEEVDFWRKVAAIQVATRVVISVPESQQLLAEDLEKVELIYSIVRTGVAFTPSLTARMDAATAQKFCERSVEGIGEFRLESSSFAEVVLGLEVPLGPVKAHCPNVRMAVQRPEVLHEIPGAESVEVEVIPFTGEKITLEFERWLR